MVVGVTIVDVGVRTIDVSSYGRINAETFEEIAIPQCTVFILFLISSFYSHVINISSSPRLRLR